MVHHQRLNRFQGQSIEFYFRSGQIVSLADKLFQHQVRFRDSFGTELIGHYMIDEHGFEVTMEDESLTSFRTACEALAKHKG